MIEQQLRDASDQLQTALGRFQLMQTFSIANLDSVALRRHQHEQQQQAHQQRENNKRIMQQRSQDYQSSLADRDSTKVDDAEDDDPYVKTKRILDDDDVEVPETIGAPEKETMIRDVLDYDEQLLDELFESELDVMVAVQRVQKILQVYEEHQKDHEEEEHRKRSQSDFSVDESESRIDE
eukprot:TRINITY_DN10408_c0_g1_i1.p2 TRINITY_DN10408_c0_g1~~TRINITY_DN10408_c0_g1_i1.p2  ORF type:complete len:180 (+),score=14.33 TRINITY_DN10408_c0_g1_i1:72-611(+)